MPIFTPSFAKSAVMADMKWDPAALIMPPANRTLTSGRWSEGKSSRVSMLSSHSTILDRLPI